MYSLFRANSMLKSMNFPLDLKLSVSKAFDI